MFYKSRFYLIQFYYFKLLVLTTLLQVTLLQSAAIDSWSWRSCCSPAAAAPSLKNYIKHPKRSLLYLRCKCIIRNAYLFCFNGLILHSDCFISVCHSSLLSSPQKQIVFVQNILLTEGPRVNES